MRIPSSLEDLTPQILNPLLERSGILQDQEIKNVRARPIGASFAARIFLLDLTTAAAAYPLPRVVVKLPSENPAIKTSHFGMDGAYVLEDLFYSEFANLSGLPCPEHYFAHCDIESSEFFLVLEDLSSWESGSFIEGASKEQADLVVQELASLHARFWNDFNLKAFPDLWPTRSRHNESFEEGLKAIAESDLDVLPAGLLEIAQEYAPHRFDITRRRQDPPFTFVHGDAHIQNMMFRRSGTDELELKVLDYGGIHASRGTLDLAYFLEFSLEPDNRRNWEEGFLRTYHRLLLADGVKDYSFDELLLDYRYCLFYCLGPVFFQAATRGVEEAFATAGGIAQKAAERLVALVDWDCGELVSK